MHFSLSMSVCFVTNYSLVVFYICQNRNWIGEGPMAGMVVEDNEADDVPEESELRQQIERAYLYV